MQKRSPRYPRQSLPKALEMVKKMFAGAHQSKMDVDTAARVIGYSSSSGGAAASALGALRQYGLVDGLRGDVAVSDLALRILQPMNDQEKAEAISEAANKPEIFSRINAYFKGKIPPLDDPIKSYLIRNEGFSSSGADDVISAFRDTFVNIADPLSVQNEPIDNTRTIEQNDAPTSLLEKDGPSPIFSRPEADYSEIISLPLGSSCRAELRLIGTVGPGAYGRLIRHLELLRENLLDEE